MQSQVEGELDWLNSSNARPCIICLFESSFILLKIMLLLHVWQSFKTINLYWAANMH